MTALLKKLAAIGLLTAAPMVFAGCDAANYAFGQETPRNSQVASSVQEPASSTASTTGEASQPTTTQAKTTGGNTTGTSGQHFVLGQGDNCPESVTAPADPNGPGGHQLFTCKVPKGQKVLIPNDFSAVGAVSFGNTKDGNFTNVFSGSDPKKGWVTTCIQTSCWVRADFDGASITTDRVESIINTLRQSGCEGSTGCTDVGQKTWVLGQLFDNSSLPSCASLSKGSTPTNVSCQTPPITPQCNNCATPTPTPCPCPTVTPTPTPQCCQPPTTTIVDCGPDIVAGEHRFIPAGCSAGGDFFIGPSDNNWTFIPDSLPWTGQAIDFNQSGWAWFPKGGELHPTAVINRSAIAAAMMFNGCGVPTGCKAMDPRTSWP